MIVAGAGLAGLSAADELARAGAAVTILDARPRAGGRVWTIRDRFAGGQYGELGGEFVDERHERVRALAARFDLPLVRVLRGGFAHRFRTAGGEIRVSRSGPWEALGDVLTPLVRRYKAARGRDTAAAIREIATWSLREALERHGAGPDVHAMVNSIRGFFLAEAEDLSVLPVVAQLADTGSPAQTPMYRIAGGAGRLVDALIAAMRRSRPPPANHTAADAPPRRERYDVDMRSDGTAWWQQAVFYEIYVRSFQDSDDDGVGDLKGIVRRLPYLRDLGVDALWVTPFYPSPQVDFGYDVSDHEDVDPVFGTLADFDALVDAAHRRGIRVVIDIILNHTSDQHAWFQQSRTSRSSPYRDWYVWRDGAAGGGPPNNWESAFGGSAWTHDGATDQWFYHFFYPEQPDLNWRNPEVEQRMLATLDFWLQRGADGFRLDAVNALFEDPYIRDNPPLPAPRLTLTGLYTQEFVHTRRLPEVHDALRRVRSFVERRAPEAVLISEAYLDAVSDLVCFYGRGDEMHLPFNFFLAQVPTRDAAAFRAAVEAVEAACGEHWPTLVLSNHDIVRACDRYGGAEGSDAAARVLLMMLLTLRGTPFLYYGEELGLRTHDPADLAEVRDPVGRRFWPLYKGRDGARRPMPWAASPAGFTRGTPWLAPSPDAAQRNVDAQRDDPASLLQFCRALLRYRRRSAALQSGTYRTVASPRDVFAYLRQVEHERCLIVLNMADTSRDAVFDAGTVEETGWAVVLGSHRAAGMPIDVRDVLLAPLEALLLERADAVGRVAGPTAGSRTFRPAQASNRRGRAIRPRR